MTKATTLLDVILGEAVSGTPAQRYADMKAIASVIQNRARFTGVTPEQVVQNRREFNAYNRALPPGASNWRGLAQQAWDDVQTNGPIHDGMFYATPSATENLPNGLKQVHSTTGHMYFSDPQNRAIGTAVGYRGQVQTAAAQEAIAGLLSPPTPVNRLADNQGIVSAEARLSPGMAAPLTPVERAPLRDIEVTPPAAQFDMGRFGDLAPTGLFDASRFGPSTQTAASMNELRRGLLDQQLQAGILPSLDQPAYAAMQPQRPVPAYTDPAVSTQPQPDAFAAQPGALQPVEVNAGLLAEPEQIRLAQQPYDPSKRKGAKTAKNIAGALGGALLGGLIAGPAGGLLGGFLGPKVVQRSQTLSGRDYFPAAPKNANPQLQRNGYGGLSEYGREAYDRSAQVRDIVDNNRVGLF